MFDAQSELIDTQEQSMNWNKRNVTAEQNEILLVPFSNTIVNPRTETFFPIYSNFEMNQSTEKLTSDDPFWEYTW